MKNIFVILRDIRIRKFPGRIGERDCKQEQKIRTDRSSELPVYGL